ncbi:bifunctional DNA-formamidopyrimidine glycosylase/DNA-(apurinic or apyrimidinic site) lyase [Patescibacteria group bacterium]|nr:bifunctional DNA-formamidopyrimidine glycosylase/DNA-(apurinic or apyrimidinic site) lyase [Patescibacteria group bacterium]
MPELPEVETIRRQLDKRLQGARILDVRLVRSGRERPLGAAFCKALKNQTIQSVDRRAKLLIWRLEDGRAILAHLKMTGKFLFVEASHEPQKHDAIQFSCRDAQGTPLELVWNDVRKFGFMEIVSAQGLEKKLAEYGPEPLEVAPKVLAERLSHPKTRLLKAALLDQACIAGIGNIYADEACHRVGIHPRQRLGDLKAADRLRLAEAIQTVLQTSIDQQGTSAHTYVDTTGSRGGFVALLRVYGREGEPCLTCGTSIQKLRLVQRGTHVCPRCQP